MDDPGPSIVGSGPSMDALGPSMDSPGPSKNGPTPSMTRRGPSMDGTGPSIILLEHAGFVMGDPWMAMDGPSMYGVACVCFGSKPPLAEPPLGM